MLTATPAETSCYHCGENCQNHPIQFDEKSFCCEGCKTVYSIINKVELCDYYNLNHSPGVNQKHLSNSSKFAVLDDVTVQNKLIKFKDNNISHVTFYTPQMHCSSCIWLLEHLTKIDAGILSSQVNFLKKEVTVVFQHDKVSLRTVAEILTSVGYEPHISLNDLADKGIKKYNRTRIFKIGVAGFAFGNIMMLSFPEYFSGGHFEQQQLGRLFSWLNLVLALPVFFYSASEFYISAWGGLKQKFLNIDAPIVLAIVITFGRSVFEIVTETGAGYLDSMSGIVFFMLVGRFFQDKTYSSLTFNRDYTSYFPLGVTRLEEDGSEKQVPVSAIHQGDRIKVLSGEIIPADAILFMGKAQIDYSFVTGESIPVDKQIGEIIYAGGRQTSGALELEVVREVSQSYLTQLWNNDAFRNEREEKKVSFIHRLARQFTWVLFSIAITSAIYWSQNDPSRIWSAVTAVLIVACPCALLLSATFTNGSMLRMLQKFGFYARNANVIERIGEADTLVFDKTGTITVQQHADVTYEGQSLTTQHSAMVRTLAAQSSHPLSRAVVTFLPMHARVPFSGFREIKGAGIEAVFGQQRVRMGSPAFLGLSVTAPERGSAIYIEVDGGIVGRFTVSTVYREHLQAIVSDLKNDFEISVLSGDNAAERGHLSKVFGNDTELRFNCSPHEKLEIIQGLQKSGRKVIMTGDGLNDAGALQQSDAGIAITDNVNNFSPACDVIFEGKNFGILPELIRYCKQEKTIIAGSFIISILYNFVGLWFAVQGTLEPVIAAILMPISSVSIVVFTTSMSSLLARKLKAKAKALNITASYDER